MQTSTPRLLLWTLCLAALSCGKSPVYAQQESPASSLLKQAYRAQERKEYASALAIYDQYAFSYPPQWQDDIAPLLSAANCALLAGDKEGAFAWYERAFQVPAKPNAHAPDLFVPPGPLDFRGQTRWKMATLRRSQGRWSEALALYQLNRQEYPLSDGCVRSGAAAQEMALTEGECLEHLGRFDEAVTLYFQSAIGLDVDIKPEAMQRLFDMYRQTGQLPDLERNIARESATFEKSLQSHKANGWPDERLSEMRVRNSVGSYERVRQFATAARARNWSSFMATFKKETPDEEDKWVWRDAMMSLLMLQVPTRNDALRFFKEALKYASPAKEHDSNVKLRAAVAAFKEPKEPHMNPDHESTLLASIFGYGYREQMGSRQFADIPRGVKLPRELPQVLKVEQW